MPIPILSLPISDLQYALNCMEIDEIIAFSLCSKRTKNLAKSTNRKIEPISGDVHLNFIDFEIRSIKQEFQRRPPRCITFCVLPGSRIKVECENQNEFEIWKKEGFTQSDWIPHFLSIFNQSMIQKLNIVNVDKSYLDTVKLIIPRCNRLEIGTKCSDAVARMAFLKLSPIAVEEVEVYKKIFDNGNDVSEFLIQNLKSVFFVACPPLELKLNDLLVANIDTLYIINAIIPEKELNRFLKLWMKGNHRFYRPKVTKLFLRNELNREEVLRGIKSVPGNHECRLKRADGKELEISIENSFAGFRFF